MQKLDQLAQELFNKKTTFVFAESCTSGLLAYTMSKIPGVSEFMCGSFVTYRNASKQNWIGVSAEVIEAETAVCETVAIQMAQGALQKTEEAIWSASVTGHLGPDAPVDLDGTIFVGIGQRRSETVEAFAKKILLNSKSRHERQVEAARSVFSILVEQIP